MSKIKIEIGKLTFVFIVVFCLCIWIWTFILGIWVGTKITKFPEEKIVEKQPFLKEELGIKPYEEKLGKDSEQNLLVQKPLQEKEKPDQEIGSKGVFEESIKESKVKETAKVSEDKKKKIAEIAQKIKQTRELVPPVSFYSIQIASFSKKSSALKLKEIAEKEGYYSFIKKAKVNEKEVYRVFVGKFNTREEAEKELPKISKLFLVKKPLLVEFR